MLVNESDHLPYLANAMALAAVDSKLTARELSALEQIRTDIGAKKSVLSAARKVVEAGKYVVSRCGSFDTQVTNLADMLYVALVDGDMEDKEQELLVAFSSAIGLSPNQLTQMVSEAVTRCETNSGTVSCPKCSATNDPKAKFCGSCGANLANSPETSIALGYEIPKVGYAIEFADSTATGFAPALDLAKRSPVYTSCQRAKKTWHLASWPSDQFVGACQLAQLLSGVRNKRAFEKGEEIDWHDLFGFVACAQNRAASFRPLEYCFGKLDGRLNPCGCMHAHLDWTEWADWFSYGRFTKSPSAKHGVFFTFDKDRIRHDLEANVAGVRRCPHFRPSLLESLLATLPDQVEPGPNGDWQFNRAYQEVPGCIKVTEIDSSSGFEYKSEYFSDGVRPRGLGALHKLLKRVFTQSAVTDITADELLK
jgi:hypothetical protein